MTVHDEADEEDDNDAAAGADDAENDDDEENDDPDDHEMGPAGCSARPLSKSELCAAYKGKGPHAMYYDIMHDDKLRASAEILCQVARPLHEQYRNDLKAQQGDLDEILAWNASRSLGGTMSAVNKILMASSTSHLFRVMRVSGHCNPPVDYDPVQLEDDIVLAEKAFRFSIHLAGNYAWSEQYNQLTLPMAAASLLSQSQCDRLKGLKHLKRLVKAITLAEDLVSGGKRPDLEPVLSTLAFQEEPLARELMILLTKGRFNCDEASIQDCVKVMTRYCGGSSSTKEVLESTFGHLSYCVSASNKNKRLNPHCIWYYATSSPYVAASGMDQRLPTTEEWQKCASEFGQRNSDMMKNFNRAFLPNTTAFPEAPGIQIPCTVASVQKTEWRLAGGASVSLQ